MIKLRLIGTDYNEDKNFIINRPKGSGDYLFLLFHSDVYMTTNGKDIKSPPGTAIIFTPNQQHYYNNPYDGFNNDWFHFNENDYSNFLNELQMPINSPFTIKNPIQLQHKIQEIEREFLLKQTKYEVVINNLVNNLFIHISREYHSSFEHRLNPHYHDLELLFREIRTEMLTSFTHKWNLRELAIKANLSPSRFSYLYKYFFAISPKEDLQKERMNIAKHSLSSSSQPINIIASRIGYDDIYQFSKQFKNHVGVSPSLYRNL